MHLGPNAKVRTFALGPKCIFWGFWSLFLYGSHPARAQLCIRCCSNKQQKGPIFRPAQDWSFLHTSQVISPSDEFLAEPFFQSLYLCSSMQNCNRQIKQCFILQLSHIHIRILMCIRIRIHASSYTFRVHRKYVCICMYAWCLVVLRSKNSHAGLLEERSKG